MLSKEVSLRFAVVTSIALSVVSLGATKVSASENIPADSAIGRLNHAGFKSRSHCTGFVMIDGPLVTAAHCVPNIAQDQVHVLLGYESGTSEQHLRTPAKSYRQVPQQDIATLCGYENSSHGFSSGQTLLEEGMKVTVRGYGAPRVHVLQKTRCMITSLSQKNFVRLDCDLPPGTSGAPVTIENTRDIIGVVSASSSRGALVSKLDIRTLKHLCQ